MSINELTPEQEEKLINKIADEIIKRQLELPASLILELYQPVAPVFTTLGFFASFPYIVLLGDAGFDYTSLFMKRENVEKLRKKIEDKKIELDENKKEINEKKLTESKPGSLLGWIRGKKGRKG